MGGFGALLSTLREIEGVLGTRGEYRRKDVVFVGEGVSKVRGSQIGEISKNLGINDVFYDF